MAVTAEPLVLEPADVAVLDEAWLTTAGSSGLHIRCCRLDEFYCGARFHPEAEATAEHTEDEACPMCVDIRYEHLCPAHRPTHQHCPFDVHERCPKT